MTVYIEYVFLQNFVLDGALLFLSCKAAKMPIKWRRIFFSALFGAVFAVLYPLLRLPDFLGLLLKISVGLLLCLFAYGKVKRKKDGKAYFLFTAVFFVLTFFFGGVLGAIAQSTTYNKPLTPFGFACISLLFIPFFKKLYNRATMVRNLYDCVIYNGNKVVTARGFYDSGNRASKGGVPVCFLSPEIVYELWGEESLFSNKERGQVCDELSITTVTGTKKIALYKGTLQMKTKGESEKVQEVYFAPSVNMISREYTIILHSRIFDEGEEL